MTTIRREGGPTRTNTAGTYRLWLSDLPSADSRRRFLVRVAQSQEAGPLQISLDENVQTLTFVSSGDLEVDIRLIDSLLEDTVDPRGPRGK